MANQTLSEAFNASTTYAANQIKGLGDTVVQGGEQLAANMTQLGQDLININIGDDLANTIDVAGDVAGRFLKAKIDALKESLTTKTSVEIRSFVGEVAPYVKSPVEAVTALTKKIDGLVEYYFSPKGYLADLGKDFLSYAQNDPAVQSTLANLSGVKAFASSLNTAFDFLNTLKQIFGYVEPILPIFEVTADLFAAWRTQNAASGMKGNAEIVKQIGMLKQQLATLLLGSFRRWVYSLRVEVPNFLLGAISTLSVRDAMVTDKTNGWFGAIFDESFYDKTVYSYTWEESWNKTIRDTLGAHESLLNNWENLNFTDYNGNPITRGEFMKSKFMTTFTQNFMRQAVATARKEAKIRQYSSTSWIKDTGMSNRVLTAGNKGADEVMSFKDYLRKYNAYDASPFISTGSIRTLSGQILERYN